MGTTAVGEGHQEMGRLKMKFAASVLGSGGLWQTLTHPFLGGPVSSSVKTITRPLAPNSKGAGWVGSGLHLPQTPEFLRGMLFLGRSFSLGRVDQGVQQSQPF